MECADGRKKFDGPSYWELFAQFYYRDISTPEYCRMYSRGKHMFKPPGKVCLMKNGEWVLSKNKVKIPEGWYAGGLPREE